MARQEIGDFEGAYPTADFVDARNIRGNFITGQVIELAGPKGVIRTEDFVSGSTGWAIRADGTAEFNDVTVRGTIIVGAGSDVDWSYISNVSIDNADITSLTFDKIVAGSNSATLTMGSGGVIRSNTSGNRRVQLESGASGMLRFYSASNIIVGQLWVNNSDILELNGAGGSVYFRGSGVVSVPTHFFDSNIRVQDGSVSSPGIQFRNDLDTGIYRAGPNDGRLVAGGSSTAQWTTNRFGPGQDNFFGLGAATQRWSAVYAQNGTIQTSDIRQKDVHAGNVPGLDFINKLSPFRYTWKEGQDTSVHWGLSAQQVEGLIGNEGPFRGGENLGLNYAELVPALIVAVQELSAKLEAYA